MLLRMEGFDDFATNQDIQTTGFATSGTVPGTVTVVPGRGGLGHGLEINMQNAAQAAWRFPARGTVVVGFAMDAAGCNATNYQQIVLQGGGVPLFTIRQTSATGLQFFDCTCVEPTDLSTGLLGSSSYNNWSSYVEVKLITGLAGSVEVHIDGQTAFSGSGNFSRKVQTFVTVDMNAGQTTMQVDSVVGAPVVPFLAAITPLLPGETLEYVKVTAITGVVFTIVRAQNGTAASAHVASTGTHVSYFIAQNCDSLTWQTLYGPTICIARFDDLYVIDTTGASPLNDFLGNVHVLSNPPTGDGAELQWTPNAGTTHYTQVDEYPIDYGTTFVDAPAAGVTDTYTFPPMPSPNGTIAALQVRNYATTDSGGTDRLQGVARIGGVDHLSPTGDLAVGAVYTGIDFIFPVNPATGFPWQNADVDAAQFGQKRTV